MESTWKEDCVGRHMYRQLGWGCMCCGRAVASGCNGNGGLPSALQLEAQAPLVPYCWLYLESPPRSGS